MTEDSRTELRLRAALLARVKALCLDSGESVSGFLRNAILREVERRERCKPTPRYAPITGAKDGAGEVP